jgi:hypothetical protein
MLIQLDFSVTNPGHHGLSALAAATIHRTILDIFGLSEWNAYGGRETSTYNQREDRLIRGAIEWLLDPSMDPGCAGFYFDLIGISQAGVIKAICEARGADDLATRFLKGQRYNDRQKANFQSNLERFRRYARDANYLFKNEDCP